jgi:hypothetical protein
MNVHRLFTGYDMLLVYAVCRSKTSEKPYRPREKYNGKNADWRNMQPRGKSCMIETGIRQLTGKDYIG